VTAVATRRRAIAAGTALLAIAGGGLLLPAAVGGDPADAQDPGGEEAAATATAVVVRRDLVEREELDGTLGYGEARDLSFGGQGTVTALPAAGTVVDRGGQLGEVDGDPVPLLFGDRPMWRAIGEGADVTDGQDIAQLEANLIALGYGTVASLGPNETWSQATTTALEAWQDDLGIAETGRLEPGDVVFAPGPVRIAAHLADVGGQAGGPALSATGLERLVDVDLDASRQGIVAVGQVVEVELPDGSVVGATVRSIASSVTPGDPMQGTSATVAVVVVLDDATAAAGLDQAPVEVRVVSVQAEGALAVPIEALLALAEGGYAVERADGSLVGVELGADADGYVAVTPLGGEDLEEGDELVVPA
jgi:hypothetical protein